MPRFSVLLALALLSTNVWGQAEPSRFDVFGGYSVAHVTIHPDVPFGRPSHVNGSGFNVSATGYFNRWFGVLADFSAHFNQQAVTFNDPVSGVRDTASISTRAFPLQFGPQFRLSGGRVAPFGRVMFGWFRRNIEAPTFKAKDSDFGFSLGGGLDVQATKHLAVRVGQGDYIRSHLTPTDWQNNFRFSAGLVLKH